MLILCLIRASGRDGGAVFGVMVVFIRVYNRLQRDIGGSLMGVLQVYMDGQFDVDFRETLGIYCLLCSICRTPQLNVFYPLLPACLPLAHLLLPCPVTSTCMQLSTLQKRLRRPMGKTSTSLCGISAVIMIPTHTVSCFQPSWLEAASSTPPASTLFLVK